MTVAREFPGLSVPDPEVTTPPGARRVSISKREVIAAAAVVLLVWVLVGFYLATAIPRYTASVVIGSAGPDSNQSSALSSALSALSIPTSVGRSSNATEKYLYIITTPSFAKQLMEKHGFEKLIFRDRWDGSQWTAPRGLTNTLSIALRELFGYQPWAPPDEVDVANYLSNNLLLEEDNDSGFVKISFDNANRDLAARVLDIVTTEGDAYLKEVNEGLYLSQLDFVTKKIAETSNLEVINALRAYLVNVVLSKTLLSDSNSYAIRTWGGVSVTSLPTKPPVVMAFLLGFVLGPILAVSLIFFGRWIRPKA
ncbi:hypothetical protein [Inquilinus limosus]|uniref:hypothetical protein n=1 Tax=Inquilinus limosus TaxID=171674 RepID=UPI0009DC40F4|nr:hypothetical protein [Inquilinus limosus]